MTRKLLLALFLIPISLFSYFTYETDPEGRINTIDLQENGTVNYIYDGNRIVQIIRKSLEGKVLYTHTYTYNEQGYVISEDLIGNVGQIQYEADFGASTSIINSPYHQEICEYNDKHQLIKHTQDGVTQGYQYNDCNELILDDKEAEISYEYHLKGNLVKITTPTKETYFNYDEQGRLIQTISDNIMVEYTYNQDGARRSKTVYKNNNSTTEYYVVFNNNPIAIYDENGELQQLRIPGISQCPAIFRAIAIETPTAIYAPIYNVQNNILKLIDIETKKVHAYTTDVYGTNLSEQKTLTPWIFSNKHYDYENNLVYCGAKYYSPEIKQWITQDLIENPLRKGPYQYCLSNPFMYCDPDGNVDVTFLSLSWGAGLAITCPLWGTYALTAASTTAIGYYAPKAIDSMNHWIDNKTIAKRRKKLSAHEKAKKLYDKYASDYIPIDKLNPIFSKKEGGIDPTLPKNPLINPNLKDISHPEATAKGHHTFKEKKTGAIIRYDEGKPGTQGHKAYDHYHRINPKATGKENRYLDANGNPVSEKSEGSHLYLPGNDWWNHFQSN